MAPRVSVAHRHARRSPRRESAPADPIRRLPAVLAGAALLAGLLGVVPAAASPGGELVAAPAAPTAPGRPTPTAAPGDDLTQWVNPFVGTQNFGNTFPGPSAPFGMVQLSPDTGGQGGYDYQQDEIYGFSQTHLSGVGCGVVGELPVMPTTGPVDTVDHTEYGSHYSHDDEQATPGYYRVGLSDYGIDAELTATDRTGWQRYTFPAGEQANVLFNTAKANMRVFDSEVHVVGDRTVEGRITDGNFCAGKDEHTVYFSARFDTPFSDVGTWTGSTISAGSRDAQTADGGNGAYVTFPDGTESVTLKVALSYTGMDGARANLQAETGDSFDFDATREALAQRWNERLHTAAVTGGTDQRRTAYYTALYHAQLHPNLAADVDGKYLGWDHQIHTATDYTPRQNFSLWDTYRPQNQLLEIIAPDVARDSYLSLLAIGEQGGWLPRWALVNSETNIMTGDPVSPFLVEGWSKGFLAGHEEQAYALLKQNATSRPPVDSQYNGRSGQHYYSRLGYIPFGLDVGTDCVSHGGDNDCDHPASATLEYAAADASLALMAAGLGHRADARMFAERGRWYSNLWDSRIGQFRPRMSDGSWLTPYDPVAAAHAFHEGGAYQYQWMVPQDPAGLIDLIGGIDAAARDLDAFFAYQHLLTDPDATIVDDWISAPYDYYAKPTYNPNNEPDLLAPYMYAYVQQPAKTATVVRAAFRLFTTGPDGMTGNDDLGTMSAWYVFSSWGMYPTMSGGNFFVLSSPQFDSVTVDIGSFGDDDSGGDTVGQGGTLSITAPGSSDTDRYVQSLTVNGQDSTRSWVGWDALRRGGELAFTVGDTPSAWGTRAADVPPSTDVDARDRRRTLAAEVTPNPLVVPTSIGRTQVTVSLVAQAPGALPVTVTADGPDDWQLQPERTRQVLRSKGVPASTDIDLGVTLPDDVATGDYEITVTAAAPGVDPVERTVPVQVRPAPDCAPDNPDSCAVDLSDAVNHDGTATVDDPGQGNFDGGGWSYDAALLPRAGTTTIDGARYLVSDPAGTADNFVQARGQTLLVPPGEHGQLRILGAAHGGDVTTQVVVGYADGSTETVPVTLTDWAAGEGRGGNTVAIAMPHRIKAGHGVDGPPVQIFGTAVDLDPGRTVLSLRLPDDDRMEIYALTLD